MRSLKRAIHIDFHTLPGIYDFGRDFDAEEFAETLQNAHVTIINQFFQCNIGHVYYPTEVGVPYPTMQGDMFGDIVRACHKRGIRVVGYTNTALNHVQALLHPEWCRVNNKGQIVYDDMAPCFMRTMCYNSDGYRQYMTAILKEVTSKYDIDGVFADCMNPNPYCHCPKCTRDMQALGLDINNEAHCRYFAYKTFHEFAHLIRDAVPEGLLVQQTGIAYDSEAGDVSTHAEIECLPSGSWGYDFFVPQASYARQYHNEMLYMSGRFQESWGDFGGYKGKISLENDCFDALTQGAQFSVGDHLHPAENLNKAMYKDIGDIYAHVMAYEPWTDDAKFVAEIAILRDKTYVGKDVMRGGLGGCPAVRGAARMLSELHYCFDTVNEDGDFSPYRLLILPDDVYLSRQLQEKLQAFLKRGGKVLSSGTAGMNEERAAFLLPQWDFITPHGLDNATTPYYTKEGEPMTRAMYAPGILMQSEYARAAYVKAYFDRHWDGLHNYYYAPPEKETGDAAVALHGDVCHICFRVFTAYFQKASVFHKTLVREMIEELMPDALLQTEKIPSTTRVTLTGTDAYDLLHVKTTYPEKRGASYCIVEEHNVLPAGARVTVRGTYQSVCRLPEKTPIESTVQDGHTTITLPEVTGYDMFLLTR